MERESLALLCEDVHLRLYATLPHLTAAMRSRWGCECAGPATMRFVPAARADRSALVDATARGAS